VNTYDLSANPDDALKLVVGDTAIVDGFEFLVECTTVFKDSIYLTTFDSRTAEYNSTQRRDSGDYDYDHDVKYSDFITHFRIPENESTIGQAVITREALLEALNSGNFVIR